MKRIGLLCTAAMAVAPALAHAQSTGTQTFENPDTIVVTANKITPNVDGLSVPNTPKSRRTIDHDFIQRQIPGQSIDDIINMLPGVSFQNNGPYGAAGGRRRITSMVPIAAAQQPKKIRVSSAIGRLPGSAM